VDDLAGVDERRDQTREALSFPVGGSVAPGFETVREAFVEAQRADEGGAQLCVYRDGQVVVDLWAGRDTVNDRPYTDETIAVLMSCTKGAVAAAAQMLAERGQLDFDAPVARYWPAFAQNGKADVRVRELMAHSAGLMGFEPESGIGATALLDWDRCVGALETMAPLWSPGAAYLYHFITYGILVGEVIRRVSGKTVGRFFADEIAGPLKLDIWIGLPEGQEHRRAPHFKTGPQVTVEQWRALLAGLGVDVEARLPRTLVNTLATTDAFIDLANSSRTARAVEIPAGNGVGDARSLARMYAALIGEVDGVRLIGEAAMERARTSQTAGLGPPAELANLPRPANPQAFGLGFELPSTGVPMLGAGAFGHSGAGGRLGFAHPETGVAVGYVCNTMLNSPAGPDVRWVGWTQALQEAVRR
jgi:CubicO group peptidase (beta-lactamase class C family)